jgi:hypothetical protein
MYNFTIYPFTAIIIRTYAVGFDRKIQDIVTPLRRLDKSGMENEKHEQQFCQLSHINVSILLMLRGVPVFGG